jgi:hypothetical protein
MSNLSPKIAAFWSWFEANERLIRRVRAPDDRGRHGPWEVVLAELKRIDDRLWFEVAGDAKRPAFFVTVDDDRSLFALADAVVAAAPSLARWTFTSLLPPRGFDEPISYEGTTLDPRTMWFAVRSSSRPEGRTNAVDLRIAVPRLRDDEVDAAEFIARRLLSRGLGERRGALEIGSIDLVSTPAEPVAHGYRPLALLPLALDRIGVERGDPIDTLGG